MRTLYSILFILLLHLISNQLSAQSTSLQKLLPPVPSPPHLVNDLGDMLSDEEELTLENKLVEYEKKSSNEIAIVTIESLEGNEVSEYANELGRKWDIGKSSKKNGVLILASKTDRKINISPGYGLSGVLPDITCGRIIREQIVPNFKNGNYYKGFDEAVDIIVLRAGNEFVADEIPQGDGSIGLLTLIFIFLIFGLIIFVFFYMIRNRNATYVSRRGWINTNDTWGTGGFGGGGFGGGGDSGGGGFGGFGGGGGGFDGGGSSGSW